MPGAITVMVCATCGWVGEPSECKKKSVTIRNPRTGEVDVVYEPTCPRYSSEDFE